MGLEVFSTSKMKSKIYSCKSYKVNVNNNLGQELREIVDMENEADVIKLLPSNMNQDNIVYKGNKSDLYIRMALL
jgi:hypothetical protein